MLILHIGNPGNKGVLSCLGGGLRCLSVLVVVVVGFFFFFLKLHDVR